MGMRRQQSHPRHALVLLALAGATTAACHPSPPGGMMPGQPDTDTDAGTAVPPSDDRLVLREGWTLQSSARVQAAGAQVSTPGFATTGWYPVTVPATVLAGLVQNGVYPDPYAGDNLISIPAAPFAVSWWYRTELTLPAEFTGQAVGLALAGINYEANVWLNGQQVAGKEVVVGTFTSYEWDVSALVREGAANALAIEIFAPDTDDDLALSWLDWNPSPPDHDMGLWQDVYLTRSGKVAVRGTHVLSELDGAYANAALTLEAELRNTSAQPVRARVRARVARAGDLALASSIEVEQDVALAAGETRTVTFEPAQHAALNLAQPRLWWPAQLGTPDLYDVRVSALVDDKASDDETVRFGIREVTFELDGNGHRVFRVNGKRILVRGGGWASDMMLRPATRERLDAELAYVLDLGLNTIRLEGKLESDDFYARADALGIMTMPGWMCCDRWEKWDDWTSTDHRIATASMEAQARRLRNHASLIAFLISSDKAPPANVELEYLGALTRNDWPVPVMSSASGDTAASLGPSGVKMRGPYDWIAPAYWYLDNDRGGAFGFNTETGPGPAVPEIESLRAMLTPAALDELWQHPETHQLHAGTAGKPFDNLGLFGAALGARHGAPTSLEDWVKKAQLMNYEGERAQFEAYGRNKYESATGVIHWLLNNSWPSLIWHLYGQDLSTAGGYFGAKKGNEPLHIQYSYDDQSIVVVNHTPVAESGLSAKVRVLNLDASEKLTHDVTLGVGADATTQVVTLPAMAGLSPVYFVSLELSKAGQVVSHNFYWLSRKAEIIDFEHGDWFHTPTAQFADFTALASLPAATLQATATFAQAGGSGTAQVVLVNPSTRVAFFVRLALTRGGGGAPVAPVLWQDNYVSLRPGEQRTIDVRYRVSDLRGVAPAITVSGWNVAAQQLSR